MEITLSISGENAHINSVSTIGIVSWRSLPAQIVVIGGEEN